MEIGDSNMRDENGEYFEIGLNAENEGLGPEKFIPKDPRYPDAYRYIIHSKKTHQWLLIDDIAKEDSIIKHLKKIHNIHDPWDNDPDYFKDVPIPDPEAAFEALTQEEKAKVREVLSWGKKRE
ncbi:MAG: hypothetical protein HS115_06880 [Spirochaetales bacterium]|nr:hypothetical protein [Spirochaetales bacterium]